jgi:hypothetical protein
MYSIFYLLCIILIALFDFKHIPKKISVRSLSIPDSRFTESKANWLSTSQRLALIRSRPFPYQGD